VVFKIVIQAWRSQVRKEIFCDGVVPMVRVRNWSSIQSSRG